MMLILAVGAVSGCSFILDYGSPPGEPEQDAGQPSETVALGGTLEGLKGSGLVLQFNGGADLAIDPGATTFRFAYYAVEGKPYRVTVLTQPSKPSQTCTVANAERTAPDHDISDIAVTCLTNFYTISGAVTGLTGVGLVLQLNAQEKVSVKADGSFSFGGKVESGAAYSVVVAIQPSSQTCSVSAGAGVVGGEEVSSVVVTCSRCADHETNCDDGNPCTDDACSAQGQCTHTARLGQSCADDGDPCTDDACDSLGRCSHPAKADGDPCSDDGDPCTSDTCSAGVCSHAYSVHAPAGSPTWQDPPQPRDDSQFRWMGAAVIDKKTCLMWRRDAEPSTYDWSAANSTACAGSVERYASWRLPTKAELLSLVDSTKQPTINSNFFPNTPLERFWTTTPYPYASGSAYLVDFGTGSAGGNYWAFPGRVRCVR